jgi:hypothetical protein
MRLSPPGCSASGLRSVTPADSLWQRQWPPCARAEDTNRLESPDNSGTSVAAVTSASNLRLPASARQHVLAVQPLTSGSSSGNVSF